jgi:hypothetical protein
MPQPAEQVPCAIQFPVYWNGSIYFVENTDTIKQFQLNNGLLSTSPMSQNSHQFGYHGH